MDKIIIDGIKYYSICQDCGVPVRKNGAKRCRACWKISIKGRPILAIRKPHSQKTKDLISKNRKGKGLHPGVNGNGRTGESHYKWKGDDVGYSGLHMWIRKEKGRKYICEWCGSKGATHFANLDHEYTRDLDTWAELCPKCHRNYDKENGWGDAMLKFDIILVKGAKPYRYGEKINLKEGK